ncbi:ADP-ribose diphosphatase [Parashewanella curva]|uniref:ADP-ribose pyrophosphatase n=1 Tax=Parashewanella curva TaxID=2338552 RepID=A0A3L8Q2C4_9GAMM|nr:ADP-ribose diphosphatase [Parashewanella curva]RLV60482.1 ADP-ribose diphosphatase [Parashewanella curva]
MNEFNDNDVQLLSKQTVFQGFFKVEEYQFVHRLFAGGWSQPVSREVFERGDAVVVLPYDPVLDQVVLIEQIRIPALGKSESPWLLELVAGMVDKNRTPEQVAHAELAEEAGVVAQTLTPVNQILVSPGGTSERFFFYWAKVDASKAQGFHGLDSEQEDIKVHVVSRAQAYQWLEQGKINNAATVIGLQWLQLHYQEIQG